ncbi:MAG: hypothetical protein FVQ82_08035 [Planctomycetes bacterium]|nr:hypothetical protein [Planctomycetota bacterium]
MKKRLFIVTLAAVLLFVCGCQSNPRGSCKMESRRITIITEPEGAKVIQKQVLGQASSHLGTTPITDQPVVVITSVKMKNMPYHRAQELMRATGNVMVRIEKDGYKPYNGILSTKVGQTATHKITLQKK